MKIYRETIQEYRLKRLTVRVWREIPEGEDFVVQHDEDISILLDGLCKDQVVGFDDIAMPIIQRIERVNAVEVKDKASNGCVFRKKQPC